MRTLPRLALTLCVLVLFSGAFTTCQAEDISAKRTFFAMDTVMTLNVPSADEELLDQCTARVMALEQLLSVTDEGSEIFALNTFGEAALSEDTEAILRFALDMGADTDGALDITLYPIVRAWGFTTGTYRVPSEQEISELLKSVDYRRVTLSDGYACLESGMMADLGSVAKGYAADELACLLRENGVTSGLLDLGGNLYCLGSKENNQPWRVALKDPQGTGYAAALEISDCAVVTSGCYERCFEAEDGTVYGHIFDPESGCPVDNGILSVTVIGKQAALCDALSTALFAMGTQRAAAYLKTQPDAEAILFCEDKRIWATQGLSSSLTLLGEYADWTIEWIDR